MLALLGAILIQAAGPQLPADSVYGSPELRRIVARAAEGNRRAPAELLSYRALVESEAALVIYAPEGEELTGQIEQIASRVEWHRDGSFAQRVVGHRIQAAGPNVSVLTYLKRGWTTPVLYGERLRLYTQPDSTGKDDEREPAYEAIHPFSAGRERVYRFDGGDTVAVLRLPERDVRIVRIQVTPRRAPDGKALLFSGAIDLDADRHQIVRMRGRMIAYRPDPGLGTRLLSLTTQGAAYVELENAEHEGRFWLPYRQRIELQAMNAFSESRAVIRIVSRFRDFSFNGGTVATAAGAPGGADTAVAAAGPRGEAAATHPDSGAFRLTFAPGDTLAAYDDWSLDLGEATDELSARDFDDVAPPSLRADGPPQARFGVRRFSDALRYNRVEGLFTGAGAVVAFRDAAPGLELRAAGGWAWREAVARGEAELSLRRVGWRFAVRAGRDLAHTNDFVAPLEESAGIGLLLGGDDGFDYLDRRAAMASVARTLGTDAGSRIRVEAGWAEDRPETRRLLRGPFGDDTLRHNRPIAPGRYLLTRLMLEHDRSVNASSLRPGLGARLVLERASGELDWHRVEAAAQLRAVHGPLTFASRVDAGLVLGDSPPLQTLYELGTSSGLPGYDYKAFAGDRAVLVRGVIRYDPGILAAPIRLGGLILPALAPAPAVQWQGGWTDASDPAAPLLPVLGSRETGGLRSTVDVRLTLFGGMIGVGFARPLDRHGSWDLVWSVGGIL